jgi:hypothetical protein
VGQSVKHLGERNWESLALNREQWKKLVKKAWAHKKAVEPMMMKMMMMMMMMMMLMEYNRSYRLLIHCCLSRNSSVSDVTDCGMHGNFPHSGTNMDFSCPYPHEAGSGTQIQRI